MKTIKFLDLFAGIGGFRLGMEQAGHECVGYVEWDKFARKSYEAIHNTEGEWTWHDVSTIDYRDIPRADIWTFGFPCQDISIAGKQEGFRGNRSSLFFAVTKRLRQIKEWDPERMPSYLLVENVRNFLSVNNGWDFLAAQVELDEIGYNVEWQLLNSKDFGVPQNRERVFIIGHLRGRSTRKIFPIGRQNTDSIEVVGRLDIKGDDYIKRVYDVDGLAPCLPTMQGGSQEPKVLVKGNVNPSEKGMNGKVYDSNGLAPTLTTNKGEGPKIICVNEYDKDGNQRPQQDRIYNPDGLMTTLSAQLGGRFNIIQTGLPIKEATKQGYDLAFPGDSINYSVPNSETRRGRVGKRIANTLDTGCKQGVLTEEYRIRKLTPRECWRLQSYPDWAFDRAAGVNSDSQLYKQAGNGVTRNVIYAIASQL